MPRRKKVLPPPWTQEQWHTIDGKLSFLKFKSLEALSNETGIPEDLIKLIIEDFAKNDDYTITSPEAVARLLNNVGGHEVYRA